MKEFLQEKSNVATAHPAAELPGHDGAVAL